VLSQDSLDYPRGRSFTVGSGDVNDAVVLLRVTHEFNKALCWLEPWSDVLLGLPRVKLSENLI
jgi:hypothetical protein